MGDENNTETAAAVTFFFGGRLAGGQTFEITGPEIAPGEPAPDWLTIIRAIYESFRSQHGQAENQLSALQTELEMLRGDITVLQGVFGPIIGRLHGLEPSRFTPDQSELARILRLAAQILWHDPEAPMRKKIAEVILRLKEYEAGQSR